MSVTVRYLRLIVLPHDAVHRVSDWCSCASSTTTPVGPLFSCGLTVYNFDFLGRRSSCALIDSYYQLDFFTPGLSFGRMPLSVSTIAAKMWMHILGSCPIASRFGTIRCAFYMSMMTSLSRLVDTSSPLAAPSSLIRDWHIGAFLRTTSSDGNC